jgi:hypothetical protein
MSDIVLHYDLQYFNDLPLKTHLEQKKYLQNLRLNLNNRFIRSDRNRIRLLFDTFPSERQAATVM